MDNNLRNLIAQQTHDLVWGWPYQNIQLGLDHVTSCFQGTNQFCCGLENILNYSPGMWNQYQLWTFCFQLLTFWIAAFIEVSFYFSDQLWSLWLQDWVRSFDSLQQMFGAWSSGDGKLHKNLSIDAFFPWSWFCNFINCRMFAGMLHFLSCWNQRVLQKSSLA